MRGAVRSFQALGQRIQPQRAQRTQRKRRTVEFKGRFGGCWAIASSPSSIGYRFVAFLYPFMAFLCALCVLCGSLIRVEFNRRFGGCWVIASSPSSLGSQFMTSLCALFVLCGSLIRV